MQTSEHHQRISEVETFKEKLKAAQESNEALANDLKEAVEECEQCHVEIKELKLAVTNLHENASKEKTNIIKSENSEKDQIITKLEKDVEKAEQNWKDLKKTKDKEIYDLHKEQKRVEEKLEKVETEFRNFTNLVNREKRSEAKKLKKADKEEVLENLKAKVTEFKCTHCPVKVDSLVKLMAHEKITHFKSTHTQTSPTVVNNKCVQTMGFEFSSDKSIQTSEVKQKFEKYPCFYCEKDIDSDFQALEHRVTCNGATDTPSLFSFPVRLRPMLFKCVRCGLVASCEEDIVNHKKSVHGIQ